MTALSFRPLARSDLPTLQRWLAEPHVDAWWNDALDLAGVAAKYGPRIDGSEPTHVCIIEFEGLPIGWIQWYRWADYPEHAKKLGAGPDTAGVDLAIGERTHIGRGVGPRVISQFLRDYVFCDPSIRACISDPDASNTRSIRAFQRAGFRVLRAVQDGTAQRCIVCLDDAPCPHYPH